MMLAIFIHNAVCIAAEFLFIQIKGLRIEDVVYCTHWKTPWGKYVIRDIGLYK